MGTYQKFKSRRKRRRQTFRKLLTETQTPKTALKVAKAEKEYNELTKLLWNTPSTLTKTISKIKVFRYADDVLILHEGADEELIEIKDRIFRYLIKDLRLKASPEKTSIHKLTDKNVLTKFIGFQMLKRNDHQLGMVNRNGEDGKVEFRFKRRSAPRVIVQPDIDRILPRLVSKGVCSYSKGRPHFPKHNYLISIKTEFEIVTWYLQVLRGLLTYYTPVVTTKAFLYRIAYILRFSCAKTIALKRRCSLKQVFAKNTRNLNVQITKQVTNLKSNKTSTKIYKVSLLDAKTLIDKSTKDWHSRKGDAQIRYDPFKVFINLRTALKIVSNCVRCGSPHSWKNPLQMHHTNSCKNIDKADGFYKFSIQLQRKVIPLCKTCHELATQGKINDIKFADLKCPELL